MKLAIAVTQKIHLMLPAANIDQTMMCAEVECQQLRSTTITSAVMDPFDVLVLGLLRGRKVSLVQVELSQPKQASL